MCIISIQWVKGLLDICKNKDDRAQVLSLLYKTLSQSACKWFFQNKYYLFFCPMCCTIQLIKYALSMAGNYIVIAEHCSKHIICYISTNFLMCQFKKIKLTLHFWKSEKELIKHLDSSSDANTLPCFSWFMCILQHIFSKWPSEKKARGSKEYTGMTITNTKEYMVF